MKTEEDRVQRQTDKRDQREAGEGKKGGDRQTDRQKDRRDQTEARENRRQTDRQTDRPIEAGE